MAGLGFPELAIIVILIVFYGGIGVGFFFALYFAVYKGVRRGMKEGFAYAPPAAAPLQPHQPSVGEHPEQSART